VPAKETFGNFSLDGDPFFYANFNHIVACAANEGIDLTGGKGSGGKVNKSKVMCFAVERAAMSFKPVTLTDAERLKRARSSAGLSLRALASLLGYKDKASVQNVEAKGMPLSRALKTWVESQEAGK
jgi:hypothetical protein